jgi:hypothetical protein
MVLTDLMHSLACLKTMDSAADLDVNGLDSVWDAPTIMDFVFYSDFQRYRHYCPPVELMINSDVTEHPLLIKIEFCPSQKIVSSTSILAGSCLITLYYGYVLHVVCYM